VRRACESEIVHLNEALGLIGIVAAQKKGRRHRSQEAEIARERHWWRGVCGSLFPSPAVGTVNIGGVALREADVEEAWLPVGVEQLLGIDVVEIYESVHH
jgi:hypothetical protein